MSSFSKSYVLSDPTYGFCWWGTLLSRRTIRNPENEMWTLYLYNRDCTDVMSLVGGAILVMLITQIAEGATSSCPPSG
jgi:hypothetical protein